MAPEQLARALRWVAWRTGKRWGKWHLTLDGGHATVCGFLIASCSRSRVTTIELARQPAQACRSCCALAAAELRASA